MDKISVIIRCRNEEAHIGISIQSVLDQFDNPEIIIIDNQSSDESMKVVSLFDRCNITKYSLNDNYTPGKALNFGAEKASNNSLLVLSAHSQLTKLNKVKLSQDLNKYVAVFGQQTPIYRGKKITPRYIWSHFKENSSINMYSEIEERPFLHNAFCFYNRQALIDHPFDELLQGKEDRYWAIDVVDKGYSYLYDGINYKCNHFWTTNGATWRGLG